MDTQLAVTPPQLPAEQELVSIGVLGVSQHWIKAPNGFYPLAHTAWSITDNRWTRRDTPSWAILLAIFGIPFTAFFSLLFLLIKNEHQVGFVEISADGPGFHLSTQINQDRSWLLNMQDLSARISYIRTLVAALP